MCNIQNFNREHDMTLPPIAAPYWILMSVSSVTEASFEEELVTNMTYADQMHEAR